MKRDPATWDIGDWARFILSKQEITPEHERAFERFPQKAFAYMLARAETVGYNTGIYDE